MSRTIGHPVEQQISLCAEGGGGGRRSNHTTLPSNLNPTYLKLVRSGDLFSGYYRSDVTTWVHAADLTFSIDDPVDIGLNVINTYHEGIFSADFDYFRFAKLVASRKLSIKLSGDFDYSSKGKVEVKVAALVKDADTMEAVSDAKVTVDIYYQDGALWVSDDMTENHAGTGIYEWENSSPFILYIVSDEIFLVHVKASVGDGPVASDMLLLHIDAFADRSTFSLTPRIYYWIAIIALAAGAIVGIALLSRHRKIQGAPQHTSTPFSG